MAHFAKFQAPALGNMVQHYEREAERSRDYTRPNIDPDRMWMDFNLRPQSVPVLERVQEAMAGHKEAAGRALRKDAVVLGDWVITMPKDCPPERCREFFETCCDFLESRYGKSRLLGAYIHMDEAMPHGHFPILPQADDGRLAVKRVVDRRDLQTFHQDLSDFIAKRMGERYSILLDEEQKGAKELSRLSQEDYKAAMRELELLQDKRDEIKAEIGRESERLERLQQARSIAAGRVEQLEAVYTVVESSKDAKGRQKRSSWGEIAGRIERGREAGASRMAGLGRLVEAAKDAQKARPRYATAREHREARLEALWRRFKELFRPGRASRGIEHNRPRRRRERGRSSGLER